MTQLSQRYVRQSDVITERKEFQASAMRGERWGTGDLGELPYDWREEYYKVANDVDYIIYSYSTPIAWHTSDGWTVPAVKYSVSTSRHQSIVCMALSKRYDDKDVRSKL